MQPARAISSAATVSPLPVRGAVVVDARGSERSLRVSWHPEDGVVVLSLWRDDRCAATFRLAGADVPVVVDALVRGLAAPGAVPRQFAPPG